MFVNLGCLWCYTQKPMDGFLFVAAVTTGIDTDWYELAAFTPAFDSESGDAKDGGDFFDG